MPFEFPPSGEGTQTDLRPLGRRVYKDTRLVRISLYALRIEDVSITVPFGMFPTIDEGVVQIMKKRVFAIAVTLICLSILATSTLAYFTDVETARNVITSGGIDIEVVEQQLVDGAPQPYPSDPIPVMPGTAVSKIVSVQNLEQAAWIRVRFTVTFFDAGDQKMEIPAEELAKVVLIQPDAANWTLKDGWWYCNTAVQTGDTTAPLFETVLFSGPDMDNKYQNSTAVIDVVAQAVQQANNGTSALEAQGWSAE